jgi:hypothetical protein
LLVHKASLIEKTFNNWIFSVVEVEDMKFGFVLQHRPSPNGEG